MRQHFIRGDTLIARASTDVGSKKEDEMRLGAFVALCILGTVMVMGTATADEESNQTPQSAQWLRFGQDKIVLRFEREGMTRNNSHWPGELGDFFWYLAKYGGFTIYVPREVLEEDLKMYASLTNTDSTSAFRKQEALFFGEVCGVLRKCLSSNAIDWMSFMALAKKHKKDDLAAPPWIPRSWSSVKAYDYLQPRVRLLSSDPRIVDSLATLLVKTRWTPLSYQKVVSGIGPVGSETLQNEAVDLTLSKGGRILFNKQYSVTPKSSYDMAGSPASDVHHVMFGDIERGLGVSVIHNVKKPDGR
jgi:hypothetical protein